MFKKPSDFLIALLDTVDEGWYSYDILLEWSMVIGNLRPPGVTAWKLHTPTDNSFFDVEFHKVKQVKIHVFCF